MVCRKMEKGQEQREKLATSKISADKKRVYIGNEELKQKITAKASKVKQYNSRIKQLQDNRNFQTNQGRFFKNLEGKKERTKPPNAEDATAFWKAIWSTKVEHKRVAGWIDKQKRRCHVKNRTQ